MKDRIPADANADNAGGFLQTPRLVIAAPQGRSGKTTLSLGLCAALTERGLAVQPFKKGPDYIDPSWLSEAAGRACRSLDTFFLPELDSLRAAFKKGMAQAGFALIEGNHGLYDSLENDGEGSTAALARALGAPVLLVLNAARMGRSAAAMVHGYQTFEPDTNIVGVVLNNVAQGRHEEKMRRAIETYCKLPVVGALPRDADLTIPDRHLGLTPRGENERLTMAIEACRSVVEQHVDLNLLLDLARSQSLPLPYFEPSLPRKNTTGSSSDEQSGVSRLKPYARLGVIRDRVFTFYYPENLEALEECGVELVYIDSLQDRDLPAVDALYIGGGFPEMFMESLQANRSLRMAVRQAAQAGLPVYAECGGLMYLSRGIHWQENGQAHYAEMAGVLPFEVEMTTRPQGHGYVLGRSEADTPFFKQGSVIRGHEFHHSRIVGAPADLPSVLRLERGVGTGSGRDGLLFGSTYAGYTHLHAAGSPEWAPALAHMAAEFAAGQNTGSEFWTTIEAGR